MASIMADPKDPSNVKVSKDRVENEQMDPEALRMGKQRLVTKKKKLSALKKLIVAEKEVRNKDHDSGAAGTVNESQPAKKEADASFSAFSLDAPEFVPTGWVTSTAASSGSVPENSLEADGAKEVRGSGAEQRPARKDEEFRRKGPAAAMQAPEFVPSWCQPPEPSSDGPDASGAPEPADMGIADFSEDRELAVSKAIERMSAQTKDEKSKHGQAKKEKKPPQVANLEVRHYVRQVLSDELDDKVKAMLVDLAKFQERAKLDPMKFAKLKRYCVGMSEAARSIKRDKAKCLIVAPNLDRSEADGGLDDTVEDMMDLCFEHEVPVVFSLSRNRLGKALGKNIRMSIVCVLSAEGVHQELKQIIKMSEELRKQWVMRRMALGTQEILAQSEAAGEPGVDLLSEETINDRVLSHLEVQRLVEERKRAEEKELRDATKAVDKARKQAEKRAKQDERRAAQNAEKEEEERQEQEEERKKEEIEVERRRLAAIKDAERQILIKKAQEEKERRAADEARRIAEQDAKAAAAAGIGEDDSSDEDLPAGFNADFF